ncbi:hypothetical protein GTA08_BOTSDO11856 [Neofusicoccum parvum]|uniref:Uncharacterized protein n=2 Tax=Neofusicoccum parvum TaxID=310453 RepID=R1GR68_BOTPV|nr:hypothetical protein UCRNP2_4815 [Neofusicoccum parvum UCRNP2]GME22502.1 hypothetical protein GTA08_BOTSDO11856 [Neofusicoccum parvum]GME46684.1 hypothetical protein GTA08_BOTSDO11856 [Neofusicoccum parvum]
MPAVQPSSTTWTLRLKYHKTTVLLHADALQTLSSVRAELLQALRETSPDGIAGKPLPTNPGDLQLAKMKDTSDPEKGWALLTGAATSGTKGKGKTGGEGSLKAEGVKDNAVLAFRWGGDAEAKREDEEGMDIEDDASDAWDVVLPKYEDTYIDGLEDEGIAE